MSAFLDMDCGGETVTIERTDNGDIIFHGWDEETELAAIELGFKPSACWVVWNAINEDRLDAELLDQARKGNALAVEALALVGSHVETGDNEEWTPLHAAALLGHINVVKVLIKAGANVDLIDHDGWTPLHATLQNGYTDITNVLLEAGASVDAKDKDCWTPLHKAVAYGYVDIVNILLEAGASVAAGKNHGWTPLHEAALEDHSDIVSILKGWIAEHGQ